jgi:hypothetical protein
MINIFHWIFLKQKMRNFENSGLDFHIFLVLIINIVWNAQECKMTSKESLHSDNLQFQQHQQNEQTTSPLKSLNMKETMTNGVGYPGLEQAQKHLLL